MITVITGPPCSGKTTYVAQRRKPGDIVIDFDAIARALGSPAGHGHEHHYRTVASEARHAAIAAAITCHQAGHRAWIIDAQPGDRRLCQYQAAGARMVSLTASPVELHRRADADGRPASCHAAIDQWQQPRLAARPPLAEPRPRATTRW